MPARARQRRGGGTANFTASESARVGPRRRLASAGVVARARRAAPRRRTDGGGADADRDDRRPAGVQHGRLAERGDAVLAGELVGPAGARDDEHRRLRRPAGGDAGGATARRAACRPCRTTSVSAWRPAASSPVVRHRRRQGDAAAAAAARQRPLRRRGGGERRGDAGHDLALDAGGGERLELFLEAAEDARVAALEAHDARAALRVLHEQGVDRVLAGVLAPAARRVRHAGEAALADVDPARVRRELRAAPGRRANRRARRRPRCRRCAPRTVIRSACAGAGADEDDADVVARRRDARHAEAAAPRRKRGSGSITSPW